MRTSLLPRPADVRDAAAAPPEGLIRAGQVSTVYRRLPLVLGTSVVIALVFVILLLQALPLQPLLYWLVVLYVVSAARAAGWMAYRRAAAGPEQSAYWATWLRLGAAASGLAWSIGCTYLLQEAGPQEATMLVITMLAVAAVGAATLAPDFPSLLIFLSLALGPITIELLLRPDRLDQVAGLAVAASLVTLTGAGYRIGDDMGKMLKTEWEMGALMLAESRSRLAAEEANESKSVFLANMSHEVRTPLNGVLGMTELLIESATDADQLQHLSLLRASANNLLTIVNDILDLSKVEAGKLQIERVAFDLRSLLDEIARFLGEQAQTRGVELSCVVDPDVPTTVTGDPVRFRQVLHNLGTNAVKFTPAGQVYIRVTALPPAAAEGCVVRVEVSDTGIGIPTAMRGKLFQPFVQADSSTSRRFGGTGLGLSIAQRLVTLMGGTIGVESVEGAGSTFWFTVPLDVTLMAVVPGPSPTLATCRQPNEQCSGTAGSRAASRPQRVLLVEDNEVNQILARRILERAGCHVDVATNGLEAIDARWRADYDVVLMDCQMPLLDGFEATRRIRSREAAQGEARVRIVAVTASAIHGEQERCLAAGMDAYLTKPYSPAALLARLA